MGRTPHLKYMVLTPRVTMKLSLKKYLQKKINDYYGKPQELEDIPVYGASISTKKAGTI